MEKKVFPTEASDYDLLEEIGHGAFAVVYRAICKPSNQTVAVKCLDLDSCSNNLTNVSMEAQIMSLMDHPNIVKAYCSFIVDHFLWVVMPYMDGGSCLHIMKIQYPEGLDEPVIAVILKETLKGLDYLHQQQQMHRDVKAGNILIDTSGAVKLSDFGTSACMFNRGDRQRFRKTVTGSPCWMAPEVLEEKYGYDCSADIWSFGITALELAHGHAPFSKYPPQKVLLMTMTSAAPSLDREKDKHFSRAFKDVIKSCLNKEPSKRPTTEKLLKHPFFKHTKSNSALVLKLLSGLGPLWEREKILRDRDAALLASRKPAFLQEEERSRNEYKRGVSAWNFDLESLKDQAASIHDEEDITSTDEVNPDMQAEGSPCGEETRQPLTLDTNHLRRSFEKEPKQFGRFGVFDGDLELESPGWHVVRPIKGLEEAPKLPTIIEDKGRIGSIEKGLEDLDSSPSHLLMDALPNGKCSKRLCDNGNNGGVILENGHILGEKGKPNGCLLPPKASIDSAEEKHKENRLLKKSFSATPLRDTELTQMPHELMVPHSDSLSVPASHLGPQLKSLLLQTAKQYEVLADLLRVASPGEAINVPLCAVHSKVPAEAESGFSNCASNHDPDVEHQVYELQSKVASLTKELVCVKHKNMQLERQLNAIYNRQEEERIRREEVEEE